MSAVATPIMTKKKFKDDTNPKNILKRGRGKRLKAIDDALGDWNDGAIPVFQYPEKLIVICQTCREWLRRKEEKQEGGTANMRKPVIELLLSQAFTRLQYEVAERRKHHFTHHLPNGQLKGLSNGYTQERTTYLRSGKTAAISGTSAHQLMERGQDPNYLQHMQNTTGRQFPVGQSVANMTDNEFTDLVQTFATSIGTPLQVMFLKKQERLTKNILVINGLFYQSGMTPYNTMDAGMRNYEAGYGNPYAMDQYGDLLSEAANKMGDQNNQMGFNHSTFAAGKDVICAGMIIVNQGRLEHIDTFSGHYKPGKDHLVNLLNVLHEQGVDLTRVQCGYVGTLQGRMGMRGHGNGPSSFFFRNAEMFRVNPNIAPTRIGPAPM